MTPRLGSALLFLAAALPATVAAQGRTTYCCTDDSGRQVCSDVLPQQCYGRAYREIAPSGRTVRRTDAPLTAEQRAMKEAEAKKAKEEELRRQEQDRKNRALLATYSSEQDIDYVRDRAVADIEKSIKTAQDKQAELAKRQKKLDAEAEFYQKKSMPPQLQAQLADTQAESKALEADIAAKRKDIESIKARYDEEKQRYRELTKQKTGTAAAAPPAPSGADARPR
jgi:hypothetical protein